MRSSQGSNVVPMGRARPANANEPPTASDRMARMQELDAFLEKELGPAPKIPEPSEFERAQIAKVRGGKDAPKDMGEWQFHDDVPTHIRNQIFDDMTEMDLKAIKRYREWTNDPEYTLADAKSDIAEFQGEMAKLKQGSPIWESLKPRLDIALAALQRLGGSAPMTPYQGAPMEFTGPIGRLGGRSAQMTFRGSPEEIYKAITEHPELSAADRNYLLALARQRFEKKD